MLEVAIMYGMHYMSNPMVWLKGWLIAARAPCQTANSALHHSRVSCLEAKENVLSDIANSAVGHTQPANKAELGRSVKCPQASMAKDKIICDLKMNMNLNQSSLVLTKGNCPTQEKVLQKKCQ